jgi:uncharacterized lipoprotein YmbA
MRSHSIRIVLSLCTAALLGGCASKERAPSYYLLTPAASGGGTSSRGGGAAVLVRAVEVPSYLNSIKIATRAAGNQVQYSATDRWAQPLPEGIGRAIADSLSRRHGLRASILAPGAVPAQPRVDLRVRVDRFEGDDAGQVVLMAHWALYRAESAQPFAQRDSRLVQTGWTYGDYAALATMLSTDIDGLADEIARAAR